MSYEVTADVCNVSLSGISAYTGTTSLTTTVSESGNSPVTFTGL